jgi:AcrR family transcriptional regulator
MQRTLLASAMDLMQRGVVPSVSEVAEAAGVSRATAYRYFPTQASMIQATVGEALGPILAWKSDTDGAENRASELIAFAYPRIEAYEATHRATVLLSLYQWTRRRAGTLGDEEPIVRGHRRKLLTDAMAPLKGRLSRPAFDRLVQALSLVFGTEAFIVLKDIWGLDGDAARRVAIWAANAIVRAASSEAAAAQGMRTIKEGSKKASANGSKRTSQQ